MVIALAGATGLTGGYCLNFLLEDPRVDEVVAIVRRPTGVVHPKLSEVLLFENRLPVDIQADAFICCLGTTIRKAGSQEAFKEIDLELPLRIGRKLHQQGCRTAAVISAMGAKAKSIIFYNRIKGQMEEGFRAIGFESLSLLRPSLIHGPRQEKRFGEKMAIRLMNLLQPLLTGYAKHYQVIESTTIARVLVRQVLEPKDGVQVFLSGEIKDLSR